MATEIAEPQKGAAPGAQTINVKGMSDRWKQAMGESGIPKTPPPKEPDAPKAPEPAVKAPEPVVEPKAGIPEAPKPKPAEPVKPAEPAKPAEPSKPIPSAEFKKLEAARDEYKTKLEVAEKKAQEIEAKLSTAIDPKKIEELEGKLEKANKQAEDYKEFVDRFYLENSPSFQKAYGEKIEQSIEDAKEAVGGEVGDQLEKVFRMSPSKVRDEEIEKLSEELSSFKQAAVIKSYTELKRLQRERDAELKNSKENVKKLREHEEQQGKTRSEEFAKALRKSYDAEVDQFAATLPSFALVDGNEAQNTIAKSNRAKAEELLSINLSNPTDRARLAIWAAHGIDSYHRDKAKDELISKLQKQVSDFQGANPSIRSGAAPTGQPDTPKGEYKAGDKTVARWREAMDKGVPAKE